jgi:hypothetical protein
MKNSADTASKAATSLNNAKAAARDTEAEIKRLTEQLYRMQSAWTQAGETLTAISKKCETMSKSLTKAGRTPTRTIAFSCSTAGPNTKTGKSCATGLLSACPVSWGGIRDADTWSLGI